MQGNKFRPRFSGINNPLTGHLPSAYPVDHVERIRGAQQEYLGEPSFDYPTRTECSDWQGRYGKLNSRRGPAYHTPAEPPPYIS